MVKEFFAQETHTHSAVHWRYNTIPLFWLTIRVQSPHFFVSMGIVNFSGARGAKDLQSPLIL